MPVKVAKRNGIFRVIEADTGKIARNAAGTPLDGGGHSSAYKASQQTRAVNRSLAIRDRRQGK